MRPCRALLRAPSLAAFHGAVWDALQETPVRDPGAPHSLGILWHRDGELVGREHDFCPDDAPYVDALRNWVNYSVQAWEARATGADRRLLYWSAAFDPVWLWNGETVVRRRVDGGPTEERIFGPPPSREQYEVTSRLLEGVAPRPAFETVKASRGRYGAREFDCDAFLIARRRGEQVDVLEDAGPLPDVLAPFFARRL